jgi:hypothetical protein
VRCDASHLLGEAKPALDAAGEAEGVDRRCHWAPNTTSSLAEKRWSCRFIGHQAEEAR